mgnify:CR=1 FL=1
MEQQVEYTTTEKQPEIPIDFLVHPDADITLKGYEFITLKREADKMMNVVSVVSNVMNRLVQSGKAKPVYKENINEQGFLKNPQEFWSPTEKVAE